LDGKAKETLRLEVEDGRLLDKFGVNLGGESS